MDLLDDGHIAVVVSVVVAQRGRGKDGGEKDMETRRRQSRQ